jgi:hypothetical protein
MKRCPQCNRTYTDDALSFCLDDGTPLVSASAPSSFDPSATVQYPQARETSPQPTIAYTPSPQQPTPPPPTPPAWSPTPPPAAQKRSVWPWLLGIGAVLVFIAIGLVILLIAIARVTNENTNNGNTNNSNSKVAKANTNKNTGENTNENENTSTRSSLTTFTDDFSKPNWGSGQSQFGNIWYQDDEYHMHATKGSGSYIVMYGPDRKDYYDENATVRVGLRSVDGNPPSGGYGLVVHGEKKDSKLEDYGFLISNGDDPKYKIVLHKGGVETKLVDWTPSSVIRTGTNPNQIEVRIRERKMDFYINGQEITSVTDSEGYLRGRVGFYTSDIGEVAFDDLEISK